MERLIFNLKIKVSFLSLLFVLLSVAGYAQTRRITGVVLDDQNQPLPGAAVKAKSGSGSATTDVNGKFSISVSDNEQSLVASFIGFDNKEVRINGQSALTIKLAPSSKSLKEVVVVGYGTQRREAITGSVASIGGDAIREVPAANVSQALQGRLPGVELSQTSSQPGAAMQIRIRGVRSLSAENNPLVVLDGIPFAGSIGDINPNDIKSLDILKDASATAIYGSRGANGVILVTTNRGQQGQKAKLNFNTFAGPKEVFAKYPMMSGPEFVALRNAAGLYSTNGLDESNDVNTDWQDLLYRPGSTQSYDLGVSGGTEQGSYNFNLGYFNDKGVIPTQQYGRYSLRGSLDQGVGKYLRLGFTTNNNFNVTEGSNVGLYGALSMSPIANPFNEDGTWKRTIRMAQDETWLYTRDIVNNLQDRWLNETKAFGTYNTLYGEVKIPGVNGLKYRLNLGLNYRQSNNGAFTGVGVNNLDPKYVSSASINNANTLDWTAENLLTYDRTFAEKHQFNVVALYSASENRYSTSMASGRNLPSDQFQYHNLDQAAEEMRVGSDLTIFGLLSYMGRVMYSYDNRYMLSATLRSDGSSRLAPGHKWHTYPAISAGWNIANESFMKDFSVINQLKLRAGYGQTSNQSIAPYSTLGRLGTRPYNFGDATYSTGYYVTELPNQNLGWEFSKTWNYGLDFGVLNNRLSGTLEYYVTNTEDILYNVGLPPTSGVNSLTANIGKTQNKGIELSLNGVILNNRNGWTWEAGLNIYNNRNKIVSLANGSTRDEFNWFFVGQPINVIYDYEKVGLWQEGDPYRNVLEPGGSVGMIKVKYTGDYNADGTPVRAIGAADRQILKIDPDFQGGFNTRVGYKGFDLSAVGVFKRGGVLNSTLYGSAGYLNMLTGRRGNVKVDYWTPENTDAKYPNPAGPRSGDNPKYGSTLGYFDASYLKLRTITLGYNFQQNGWFKKTGIDRLRVYFTAQNPFVLFSPYHRESGQDPETNSYGNENAAVAYGQELRRILTVGTNAPSTRTYLFGANLTF
ncbi:SusC/RagA family TonB-linked outer membrane protein [Desertivirga brevis]|uniref:SusC/RagA family TonB-linked outer membrane protein n=1 Tax=Desertivirga brevis TaxID=2810310 RepID=UPI001A95FF19|nr:TonB-dependent receptor [Pedobacter sp. SYSU D00873]